MLNRNEERLLRFLYERWQELGRPETLDLSANQIRKEWNIIKNQTTKVTVPVEVQTTRSYVARLLTQLETKGFITYDSAIKSNPSIRLNIPDAEKGEA